MMHTAKTWDGEVGTLTIVNGHLYLTQGAIWKIIGSKWVEIGKLLNNEVLGTVKSDTAINADANSLISLQGKLTVSTYKDGVWQWNGQTWIQNEQFSNLAGGEVYPHTANGLTFAQTVDTVYKWSGYTWGEFSPKLPGAASLVPQA